MATRTATLGKLQHLENTFKILIMGDASVGKTSLLSRYSESHFGKPNKTSEKKN